MLADLVDAGLVDQRAMGDALVHTVADLELVDLGCQLRGKLGVDGLVDVDAVGADASLARATELASNGTIDGLVQVGISKDDEGSIATAFGRKTRK